MRKFNPFYLPIVQFHKEAGFFYFYQFYEHLCFFPTEKHVVIPNLSGIT